MSRASVAIGLAACALVLTGCAAPSLADQLAERTVIAIADDVMPPYPQPEDAERLAYSVVGHSRFPDEPSTHYDIDVLDWSGDSGDPEGARVDVRIGVRVDAHENGYGFNSTTVEADSAVRCWHLQLFGFRNHDTSQISEFECPEGAEARRPSPAPEAGLPQDVESVLLEAIDGADATELELRLITAFPDDAYSIAVAEERGELVGALGVPDEEQCVLVIRTADGAAHTAGGFARELLQPGEIGCSPDLWFRPVTTH